MTVLNGNDDENEETDSGRQPSFDPRDPSTWGLTLSVDRTAQVLGLSPDGVYRMLRLPEEEQPQPPLKVIRTGRNSRIVITKSSICALLGIDI